MLGSIEDRVIVLNSREEASTRIAGICARTARWLEQDDHGEQEADALRAAFDKVRPMLDADAGWVDIAVAGLVIRLRNLVDVVRDCQLLRDAIEDDFNPDSLRFAFTPDMSAAPVLHRDHGLALLAAVSVSLSVLACCGFWITTGWADGVSAPLFAAVLGSLLAGEDDPLPAFRKFYWVFLVVIAVNGIYVFGVFPRITTLEILIVALFPAFLLFGWMAARPGTARIGSMLAIYTSVQLALGSSYSADFSSFANSSIALMLGIALTGVVCGIVRLLGASWIAGRLLRSNWRTLATVAGGKSHQDRVAIAGLMQHRLALLAVRIKVVPDEVRSGAANLRQLRTALSIIEVGQASSGLSRRTTAVIDAFLARLASVCRARTVSQFPHELLGQLDATIAVTLRESLGEARDQVLIGLTGIRSGLFPKSEMYQPQEVEHRTIAA
jgi:uncharacterized membrane protein YccC